MAECCKTGLTLFDGRIYSNRIILKKKKTSELGKDDKNCYDFINIYDWGGIVWTYVQVFFKSDKEIRTHFIMARCATGGSLKFRANPLSIQQNK